MKKWLIIVLTAALTTLMAPSILAKSNQNENIFIDSRLSVEDQLELLSVMKNLDKEDRQNVLYIREDGSFTANRLEILEEFKLRNKDKIVNNKLNVDWNTDDKTAIYDSIVQSAAPISTSSYTNPTNACPSDNTGPFRRVMSKSGYSRLTADIYLPSKSLSEAYMKNGTNDKGYIYSGAVTSIGHIDMGLALNYESGSQPWNETWGMFVKGHSSESTPAEFGNYKMGQTVFFKYYTPADN